MKASETNKDLKNKVEELEAEVDRLDERISDLKLEKEELEREIQELEDEIAYEEWHREHDQD